MKQILIMYELIDISEMCYSRTDYILEQTDNSPPHPLTSGLQIFIRLTETLIKKGYICT